MIAISDFIYFNSPIIWASAQDTDSVNDFQNFLSTNFDITPPIISPPTDFTGVTTLDEFLNGNDIFLIGGPIANSASLFFQNNLQSSLAQSGIQSLTFSTGALDGTASLDNAPTLTIADGVTTNTFVRSDDQPSISDIAIIVRLQGTTNNLLYVAGIRDLGTATALFILKMSTLDPILWPINYGDVSILTGWQTTLSENLNAIVSFSVTQDQNSGSLSNYISDLNNNGVSP